MRWWRNKGYKHPSGRALGRRYDSGNGGGLFKRRQYFWQRRSFKIYAILSGVAVLFILYLLFWSGIFQIAHINVNGVQTIDSAQIEAIVRAQMAKSRWWVFSQDNLWVFDAKTAENSVKSALVLEDIKIKKRPLKTLKIELTEKNSQITLIHDGRYYVLDANGLAVKELMVANVRVVAGESGAAEVGEELIDLSAVDPNLPVVEDLAKESVTVGQPVYSAELIKFIRDIYSHFPRQDLTIKRFQVPERQGTEVRAILSSGPTVYFNSQDEPERQLANLFLIIQEKMQKENKKLNSIDLRFGEKVYIK